MVKNHLYSSQQTREPAWKRVMAALGSCAAAPTIVRITAAALTGMSHTHTLGFICDINTKSGTAGECPTI